MGAGRRRGHDGSHPPRTVLAAVFFSTSMSATHPSSLAALLLPLIASACSLVIDVVECDDNTQCIMEDGTQLVCAPDNNCVDAPQIGDECTLPRECLDPLICVAADPELSTGFCTLDCTVDPCDDPDLPADWTCCELNNGMAACLSPTVCQSQ